MACGHDNSWTAALSVMKFCTNMYFRNFSNYVRFEGHRVKVKVIYFENGLMLTNLFSPNTKKIVADNVVFRLSIAWSVPEIFAIKVYSCPKSSPLLTTHVAWWDFLQICASITSRNLFDVKVISQKWRSHGFLGVFLCAWHCGYPRTVLSLEQSFMILSWFIFRFG